MMTKGMGPGSAESSKDTDTDHTLCVSVYQNVLNRRCFSVTADPAARQIV